MHKTMKLRMGAQLAAAFAVPILALGVIVATVSIGFSQMLAVNRDMQAKSVFRAKARDVALQMLTVRFAQRGYAMTQDNAELRVAGKAIATGNDDVQFLRANLRLVPAAAADLDTIAGAIERIASRRQLSGGGSHAADEKTKLDTRTKNAADFQTLKGALDNVMGAANDAYTASVNAFEAKIRQLVVLMLVIGTAAVLATIVITTLMSRRMTRRLGRVSGALEAIVQDDFSQLSGALVRLSEGDLRSSFRSNREPIPDAGHDEIGELVASYNFLADGLGRVGRELTTGLSQLRELIGGVIAASRTLAIASDQTSAAVNQASVSVDQIAKAIDSVAGGAQEQALKIAHASAAIEELARSAEMIADGATHQASAIQQATGGIQQLDEGIESLSSHGSQLARTATDASTEATGGNEAVSETQRAMQRLREVSVKAADAMVALEQRSTQVEEIVRTIEEIADQTNLLALNAAIEAARAGDHGRGFAVVADEVRKLAERSAGATREISTILSSIRRETITAAEAMRSSDQSMQSGLTVAERASTALDGISRAVGATTGVAQELADRARAMREASLHITEHVASASAGVEENAAAATQMRITTRDITATMMPVAQAAEEQSAAAQQAAVATGELASGVQEIDATARALRDQAGRLDMLVARFVVEDEGVERTESLQMPNFRPSLALNG
jgi:methyl-accepting chemotaxis protein